MVRFPRTRLSETSISSRSSLSPTTSSGLVPNTTVSPTSSGDNAADEDNTDAAADFAAQRDAAVAAITAATQAVLEFLYAYAVVVYHEGLALVEQGFDLVKDIRRKWRERSPVRPALRRLVRRRTGLVGLGVGLIVLVLVLSYWKVSSARDRAESLSAQEWQVPFSAKGVSHTISPVASLIVGDTVNQFTAECYSCTLKGWVPTK